MKKLTIIAIALAALAGCIAIEPSQRITFEAPDAYPEGVAFDSTKNVYYVSSARLGQVGKVTPAGTYSVLHNSPDLKSTYGIKVHPDGKQVLICVGDANYSKFTSPETRTKLAKLISVDTESGKRMMEIDLSKLIPGKHFVNDMAIDNNGNIYLTDSFAHAVYKVTADGKASIFAKSPLFETEGIGLNGIVYHPAGFLLVDNTNTGQLYKIDIANPQDVKKVTTDQFFLGADGLLLDDANHLTMVVNGGNDKIYKLETTDNWQSASLAATTLIADRFTYPATATRYQNTTWIMNARFNELLDSNMVPATRFAIQKAVFKPLPKSKTK
jgi:hypothetical protein